MLYDSRTEESTREKLREICDLPDCDILFDCLDDCAAVREMIRRFEDGLQRDVKLLDGVYQATREARLDIASYESTLFDRLGSSFGGSSGDAASLLSFARESLDAAVRSYRIDPAVIAHGLTLKTPSLMALYLDSLVGVVRVLPVWTGALLEEPAPRLETVRVICEAVLKLNPFAPEELNVDSLREASDKIDRLFTQHLRVRLREVDAVLRTLEPETGNDKKTPSRGGRRAGAGRRPYSEEGTKRYSFVLTETQFRLVKEYVESLRRPSP